MRRTLRVFQGWLVGAAITAAVVAVFIGFQAVNDAATACPKGTTGLPNTNCLTMPSHEIKATVSIALGITALACAASAAAMNGWGRREPR